MARLHAIAVGPAAGRAPARHEGHAAQAADGRIAPLGSEAEAAVVVLPAGQPLQSLVDGPLCRRVDHFRRRLLRIGGLRGGGDGEQEEHRNRPEGAREDSPGGSFDPIRLARMVKKVEWLKQGTKTDTTPSSLPGW